MKRALLSLVLLAGCSSGLSISYHRVPLGSDERTLMVLLSEEEDMDGENPIALLERLKRKPGEKLHAVVGQIGEGSFAAIDSGSGSVIVTKGGPGSPQIGALLREVEERLGVAPPDEVREDLTVAKKILEGLPR